MFCRHWHSFRPHLQNRANGKLKGWHEAPEIFVGRGDIEVPLQSARACRSDGEASMFDILQDWLEMARTEPAG